MAGRSPRSPRGLLAACALFAAGGSAFADTDVDGQWVPLVGHSTEWASFENGFGIGDGMYVAFEDGRFTSAGASGSYVQDGASLRLEVDPSDLADYELEWAFRFGDAMSRDGLEGDAVACRTTRASLRGRARGGEVKLKATYRFVCHITGDFGERVGRVRVRFRGKGRLDDDLAARPTSRPLGGGGMPIAGGTVRVVGGPVVQRGIRSLLRFSFGPRLDLDLSQVLGGSGAGAAPSPGGSVIPGGSGAVLSAEAP